LLRLPQVGNVGAGAEPFDDVPIAVADRHPARLEPAVDAIPPANPVFHVVRAAARDRIQPESPRRLAVVWMQGFQPAPAEQVALRDAGVLRPLGAEVIARAVR